MSAPWITHFGFRRTPFSKAIPTDQIFARAAHQEALARLSFCIEEAGIGVLVGDIGVGKTLAVRAVLEALDPARHQRIYIADPGFGTRGIYVTVANALGAQPRFHQAEVIAQVQGLLAQEHLERHRQVILCCDEAQLLTPAQLEVLRFLTNAEYDSQSHLTLLLIGQPMLARQLRMGAYAALDQRMVAIIVCRTPPSAAARKQALQGLLAARGICSYTTPRTLTPTGGGTLPTRSRRIWPRSTAWWRSRHSPFLP